jgi:hypothetical protein
LITANIVIAIINNTHVKDAVFDIFVLHRKAMVKGSVIIMRFRTSQLMERIEPALCVVDEKAT